MSIADSKYQTVDSRQQTANSKQQATDSREQRVDTAGSRQQTAECRQSVHVLEGVVGSALLDELVDAVYQGAPGGDGIVRGACRVVVMCVMRV
jgi:hypothetical protein